MAFGSTLTPTRVMPPPVSPGAFSDWLQGLNSNRAMAARAAARPGLMGDGMTQDMNPTGRVGPGHGPQGFTGGFMAGTPRGPMMPAQPNPVFNTPFPQGGGEQGQGGYGGGGGYSGMMPGRPFGNAGPTPQQAPFAGLDQFNASQPFNFHGGAKFGTQADGSTAGIPQAPPQAAPAAPINPMPFGDGMSDPNANSPMPGLWHGGNVPPGQSAIVGDRPNGTPGPNAEVVTAMPGGGFTVTPNPKNAGMIPRFAAGGSIPPPEEEPGQWPPAETTPSSPYGGIGSPTPQGYDLPLDSPFNHTLDAANIMPRASLQPQVQTSGPAWDALPGITKLGYNLTAPYRAAGSLMDSAVNAGKEAIGSGMDMWDHFLHGDPSIIQADRAAKARVADQTKATDDFTATDPDNPTPPNPTGPMPDSLPPIPSLMNVPSGPKLGGEATLGDSPELAAAITKGRALALATNARLGRDAVNPDDVEQQLRANPPQFLPGSPMMGAPSPNGGSFGNTLPTLSPGTGTSPVQQEFNPYRLEGPALQAWNLVHNPRTMAGRNAIAQTQQSMAQAGIVNQREIAMKNLESANTGKNEQAVQDRKDKRAQTMAQQHEQWKQDHQKWQAEQNAPKDVPLPGGGSITMAGKTQIKRPEPIHQQGFVPDDPANPTGFGVHFDGATNKPERGTQDANGMFHKNGEKPVVAKPDPTHNAYQTDANGKVTSMHWPAGMKMPAGVSRMEAEAPAALSYVRGPNGTMMLKQ